MPGCKIMPPLVAWLLASAWLMSLHIGAFEPRVLPDELCYLGWARLFAGEGGFYSMGFAAYCPPGYGLLLAPLRWIAGEPSSLYHAIVVLNAFIGGACLPMARHLAATHFGMGRALAWLVGIAAALYPSLAAYSGYALPETLLYALALCWAVAWCLWIKRETASSLILLALLSITMYGVHARMLVVPAFFGLAACIAAAIASSPSMRNRYLLAAVGTLLAVYGLGLVKKYALPLGWSADPLLSLDSLAQLGRWDELLTVAARASGQLLSVAAMSMGLALIPCAWLLVRMFVPRPFADRNTALKTIAAPALLIMLAIEAAIFFTATDRFDLHFYARYIGPWAMVCCVIAPGLVKGSERPISLGLGVLMIVMALMLVASPPSLPVTGYARIHVAGVQPIIDWLAESPDHGALALRVLMTTVATLVAAVSFMYLGRRAFVAATIVTGMLLARPAPDLQQEPLVSVLPVEIRTQLQKPRCRIVWSDTINESLQMRHRYRLQYLYPHCEFLTPINSECELPREGVLVTRVDSRCAWTDVETIPLPPGLLLVRGGAAGSP